MKQYHSVVRRYCLSVLHYKRNISLIQTFMCMFSCKVGQMMIYPIWLQAVIAIFHHSHQMFKSATMYTKTVLFMLFHPKKSVIFADFPYVTYLLRRKRCSFVPNIFRCVYSENLFWNIHNYKTSIYCQFYCLSINR